MIGFIKFVAVLSGLGALALTVFFAWVLIDARVNDHNVYVDPHYAASVRSMIATPAHR